MVVTTEFALLLPFNAALTIELMLELFKSLPFNRVSAVTTSDDMSLLLFFPSRPPNAPIAPARPPVLALLFALISLMTVSNFESVVVSAEIALAFFVTRLMIDCASIVNLI